MPLQFEYPNPGWSQVLNSRNQQRQQLAMDVRKGKPELEEPGIAEAEKLAGAGVAARGGSTRESSRIEKIEMPGGGPDLHVLVNPNRDMITGFSQKAKDYRSISAHGNWYYWDASKAIHNYVTKKLGINEIDVRSGGGGSTKDLVRKWYGD